MSSISKFLPIFIVMICSQSSLKAQSDQDFYASSYAILVQEEGLVRKLFLLKDATVSFPNGTNDLYISVQIPDTIITSTPGKMSYSIDSAYVLNLDIEIDANQIQQELTSLKTFTTHGQLVFNKIRQEVQVQYLPIESGLEENGNFNVFISFRISPADFGLANVDNQKVYVINLYNIEVNRP